MNKLSMLFIFLFTFSWCNISHTANSLPVKPALGRDPSGHSQAAGSYYQALDIWKTAEDINKWVATSFIYDKARAIKLSSNRPGYIAGPYIDTQAFVDEYEQYRGRKIVAFRELESYKKQRKSKKLKKSQFNSWNNVYPHHNFAITEELDTHIQTSDNSHEMKIAGFLAFAQPLIDHRNRQG